MQIYIVCAFRYLVYRFGSLPCGFSQLFGFCIRLHCLIYLGFSSFGLLLKFQHTCFNSVYFFYYGIALFACHVFIRHCRHFSVKLFPLLLCKLYFFVSQLKTFVQTVDRFGRNFKTADINFGDLLFFFGLLLIAFRLIVVHEIHSFFAITGSELVLVIYRFAKTFCFLFRFLYRLDKRLFQSFGSLFGTFGYRAFKRLSYLFGGLFDLLHSLFNALRHGLFYSLADFLNRLYSLIGGF